jgi:hypothetical protein
LNPVGFSILSAEVLPLELKRFTFAFYSASLTVAPSDPDPSPLQ